jgi:hypothetical protein
MEVGVAVALVEDVPVVVLVELPPVVVLAVVPESEDVLSMVTVPQPTRASTAPMVSRNKKRCNGDNDIEISFGRGSIAHAAQKAALLIEKNAAEKRLQASTKKPYARKSWFLSGRR